MINLLASYYYVYYGFNIRLIDFDAYVIRTMSVFDNKKNQHKVETIWLCFSRRAKFRKFSLTFQKRQARSFYLIVECKIFYFNSSNNFFYLWHFNLNSLLICM